MAYTTIDKPEDYFNTVLYTGNGSNGNAITGVGFSPEWLWIKQRSGTRNHNLWDIVRGNTKRLISNTSGAETTETSITSFDSDGFTLDSGTTSNENSQTFVAWNWLAGGSASSNSNGSITSSVSASTTAGFSIVSYTGTGSNATIGHGLGSTPAFMMIKNRGAAQGWCIYHHKNTSAPETEFLSINSTDATVDASDRWNDTAPTSSVFSVANHADTNASSANYIGYFFNEVKGYSKFGSYTGNGSNDGTFVYTGFKPAFCIVKRTDGSADWNMYDNKRIGYNPLNYFVYPNLSNAEDTSNPQWFDLLSNGFQLRNTSTMANTSGGSYIYMAFAESPFVNSNGVPTNAR